VSPHNNRKGKAGERVDEYFKLLYYFNKLKEKTEMSSRNKTPHSTMVVFFLVSSLITIVSGASVLLNMFAILFFGHQYGFLVGGVILFFLGLVSAGQFAILLKKYE
jgi:hypothetical protein